MIKQVNTTWEIEDDYGEFIATFASEVQAIAHMDFLYACNAKHGAKFRVHKVVTTRASKVVQSRGYGGRVEVEHR